MILKNLTVINPENLTAEKMDISIDSGLGGEDRDWTGIYAAPGFIDMHVHVFEGGTYHGLNPDKAGIEQGVTAVVDAGSAGLDRFPQFKREVIDKSITKVLFYLNLSKSGLGKTGKEGELSDLSTLMTLEELHNFKSENHEGLVGIKVRMSSSVLGGNGITPLVYAKELSQKTGLPLMVHVGNGPPALGEILNVLGKGDVLTHCFHGKKGGLLDYKDEFAKAVERGVHFDVGHGTASFSIDAARKTLDFMPIDFSISTDIYTANFERPVGSLMDTMTKFLSLGFSPEEIVRKVTTLPAKVLGVNQPPITGSGKNTMTIFKIVEGAKTLVDSEGENIAWGKYFQPVATIIDGKCVWSENV